jgi:predicted DNA repair protein MutK
MESNTSLAVKLEHAIGRLDSHIVGCDLRASAYAQATTELTEAVSAVRAEIAGFKALPMKAVRWLGGIIVMAAVTLLTQNFILHQESTAKAAQAASAATVAASDTNQALGIVKDIRAAQTNAATP